MNTSEKLCAKEILSVLSLGKMRISELRELVHCRDDVFKRTLTRLKERGKVVSRNGILELVDAKDKSVADMVIEALSFSHPLTASEIAEYIEVNYGKHISYGSLWWALRSLENKGIIEWERRGRGKRGKITLIGPGAFAASPSFYKMVSPVPPEDVLTLLKYFFKGCDSLIVNAIDDECLVKCGSISFSMDCSPLVAAIRKAWEAKRAITELARIALKRSLKKNKR